MSKIVAFGEIMLRLTPPDKQLIANSQTFHACYGGSEANVLCCLSMLGNETEYITALPNNSLGGAAKKHLRSYGVGTSRIIHTDNRLGTYYLEEGIAERTSDVIYDRKNSAIALLEPTQVNFSNLFADCSLFHISGITFALSDTLQSICFDLLREAKRRQIPVSFDFNYRGKLWTIEEAAEVYKKILPYVDIVFASEKDLHAFLQTDDVKFFNKYPCQTLILRERTVLAPNKHRVSISAKHRLGDNIVCSKINTSEFSVFERIGSGDAFDGGVLHVLNQNPNDIDRALQYGLACFILKHSVVGDTFPFGVNVVESFINNTQKDISR